MGDAASNNVDSRESVRGWRAGWRPPRDADPHL